MKSLGLDMGTSQIRLLSPQGNLVVNEPNQLIYGPNDTLAWGEQVNEWLHGHPQSNYKVIYPFHKSSLQAYQPVIDILKTILSRHRKVWLYRPKAIATISVGSSSAERQAYVQALNAAGFSSVLLVPRSVASLLGGQLSLNKAQAQAVIEIGAGSSEILVSTYGDLTALVHTDKTSGDQLVKHVSNWIFRNHRVRIPPLAIETILHTTDALATKPKRLHKFQTPKDTQPLIVSAEDLAPVIKEALQPLVKSSLTMLSNLPIQALADLMQQGIWISGGVAAMRHLPSYLQKQLQVPTNLFSSRSQANCQGIKFVQTHYSEYTTSLLAKNVSAFLA